MQITVRIFDPSNGGSRPVDVHTSTMKVSVVPLAATEFDVTFATTRDKACEYYLGMNFPALSIKLHDENANIVHHEGYIKIRIEVEGDDKAFKKRDYLYKVLHEYINIGNN